MNGFGWGLRLAMALTGLVALIACSSMSESDRAAIEQARLEAQAEAVAGQPKRQTGRRRSQRGRDDPRRRRTERQQRMAQQTMCGSAALPDPGGASSRAWIWRPEHCPGAAVLMDPIDSRDVRPQRR
jgi:hypothetical protein